MAKYADHLPLYRQERVFGRAGLTLPRSTLAAWVGACGVQLQPLVDALREVLLQHPVLHADETPVSMLAPGKKKTHRAYVWAYVWAYRGGPHRLDSYWTKISAFLHHTEQSVERSNETKETHALTRV